jgi:gliding motility-associated-like protein
MTQRNSTLCRLLVAAYLALPFFSSAQRVLPPNQPEQDACHALSLCGGKFFTPYSYSGTGRNIDLASTPCGSGEDNSMWLKVVIATPGNMVFRIIPADTLDDYDFAVLDASSANCSSLTLSEVVRCNFNNNWPGSNPMGIVGLSNSGTLPYVPDGDTGNSFCQAIQAVAGQTYLIMINNFGHDSTPGPSKGFTIDFSGSTATFAADSFPAFESIVKQCSDSSVILQLTKPIACSSIATDGSEFRVTPAVPVAAASGANCVSNNGYTSQVNISLGTHLPPGGYVIHAQTGTGGMVLQDLCGTPMKLPDSIAFTVFPSVTGKFLPPDTTKCSYSTIPVIPTRVFATYAWSNGQNSSTIAVTDPGRYLLHVTDSNGCAGVDSIDIRDSTCPQYVYISNAFTPNGDGRNDKFKAVFAGPTNEFRLAVYDRWGRMVFETSDPFAGWDGTTGGNPQPAGTYAYICIYRLYHQPQQMQRGTVILIR